ncbi:hypothetical protein MGG_00554 [Pyricularia oryzae 70-15]|uniref:Uncharacterized protein n=3 Tax=Pyricularia oryzae TaxID=318829 RepID=G4NBF5_PYRO7|nr:uncharacterized protein MGG_00554 [Pyricularia oryzae 70-15]EHA48912.1 hypothetical protein MGG_00554 [Pyricularia oryzae 70-15]ELQ38901.1 hypothetical protein OOU_Y34scaffold00522g56 [Pyricularia oryzae Y34]
MVLAQSRAPDPKFAFLHKQGGSGLAQPRLDGVLSHRVDEAILAAPREWDGGRGRSPLLRGSRGRGKSGGECRAAGRASVCPQLRSEARSVVVEGLLVVVDVKLAVVVDVVLGKELEAASVVSSAQLVVDEGFDKDLDVAVGTGSVDPDVHIPNSGSYWMESIARKGTVPWGDDPSYAVFRNVL